MKFRDWIKEQRHRNDSVGYLSNWFQHPKRGLLPVVGPKDFAGWKKIISTRSSAQTKEGLLCALKTSWDEWNLIETKTSGQKETIMVKSTVARLKRIVKGHHEKENDEKEEIIAVEKFQSPVSYISVSNKMTRNLGNYESMTVDFSVGIPCYPEEIQKALDFAESIVSERLEKEFKKVVDGPVDAENDVQDSEVKIERIKRPKEMLKTKNKKKSEKSEQPKEEKESGLLVDIFGIDDEDFDEGDNSGDIGFLEDEVVNDEDGKFEF